MGIGGIVLILQMRKQKFKEVSNMYTIMWIESPVYVWRRIQHAWGWCMGMTQRDVMGREVGGGFMFGNAYKN